MRLHISFALVAFAALGLLACNSVERNLSSSVPAEKNTSATPTATVDGVRRVTTAELKDLIDKGEAFVVDVRNEASFKAGHIRGAVLIPNKDVLSRVKELPRDRTIVTYCS
jgi:3-mercaptopyruvate sulfurtransferase SseA